MRISDWSSDVCSSDLPFGGFHPRRLRIDRLLQNLIDRALNKHRSIIMQNDGPPEINFIDLTADIVWLTSRTTALRSQTFQCLFRRFMNLSEIGRAHV